MPPSVVHLVVTDNFAGVERYVATTARELAERGSDVVVVGANARQMQAMLGAGVRWLPGSTMGEALRSLARIGRRDICHAHMTLAEATAIVGRPFHRAPIVSTRHFAAPRGSMGVSRLLRPLISAGVTREIATSEFTARSIERAPDAVLRSGVPAASELWRADNRTVLVLQRLEPEKDPRTVLEAWRLARLWEEGWRLRIVGSGSLRAGLERQVSELGLPAVSFAGWVPDVRAELAGAGMMLAPAPAEALGLSVLEAMAAGVPVVAAAGGGHLETVGRVHEARIFPPADAHAAAEAMHSLLPDAERERLSRAGRVTVESEFSVAVHVDRLLEEYAAALGPRQRRAFPATALAELVVCSLEPWDEVWRRNQFFVHNLLERNPDLRVLFVEPPADPAFDLARRRRPRPPRLRLVGYGGRLHVLRPLKPMPRALGKGADAALRGQVQLAARLLGFTQPTLWINDVTYAPMIDSMNWPSVYDVTDDWLAAPFAPRELDRLERLERLALASADIVTVCSQALAASRGSARRVTLIPNAVDAEHFRRPRPRPRDLPAGRSAVYVGTLHESRLDVELVLELARSLPSLALALVGPNSLADHTRRRLATEPNIHVLGARAYEDVPAYLQHADVIVVPHVVNEFTQSLDPIKAYECLAIATPTVATPVAGFEQLRGQLTVAPADIFVHAVEQALAGRGARPSGTPPSWRERTLEFERALLQAATGDPYLNAARSLGVAEAAAATRP
ncbi:MAG TPA: glycosyltransferase [Gaiellaceae bacterium]|nr:glycosyltransferase [Gaiellaceae bacterium]